jgi:hypothetical protein
VLVLLAALSGSGLAEERPVAVEPPAGQRGALAEKLLQERLSVWQERLQLQDWRVSIELSPPERLRSATLGNIRWDPRKKTATIRVLHPGHYKKPFHLALEDMEFTVVHELIHLTLSTLRAGQAGSTEEERAINQIASALLQRTPVE